MPIEIRRFGVGHRRAQGPDGTTGVTGAVIHADETGVITELAFNRGGRLVPHADAHAAWFVVIEGGGWVQVGGERTLVAAGEAVAWPADVDHAAWTEHGEMRAILVELVAGGDTALLLDGRAIRLLATGANGRPAGDVERGDGALREDPARGSPRYDPAEGEPR
jgi:quercetin dioxygenase-like cupin family protein